MTKGPCPRCDSSDANVTYDDGHEFCFSCETGDWSACTEEALGVPKSTRTPNTATHKRIPRETMEDLKEAQTIPLKARRISQKTCKHYGYVVDDKNNQVAKYYRDRHLVGLHYRTADKRFWWTGESAGVELFGQHLWPTKGKRIVVTEGEIDCMSVAEALNCKWPVVSIPSGAGSAEKSLRDNLEFLSGYDEIVLAFDGDDSGRKAFETALQLLPVGTVRSFEYPEGMKDANDMLKGDPTGQTILKRIWNAQVYRPDGIVAASSLKDELDDYFENGYAGVQYDCPLPLMNYMTNGYRKGELWLHTAGSGIGKSTIVSDIVGNHLLKKDLKIGHVALEENCKQTVLRYMSLACGKPLHLNTDGVTKEQFDEAFKTVTGSDNLFLYDHFGSMDAGNLMVKLRYLAVGCGCDFIILDHISIAVSGMDLNEDERRTIDKLMTDLRSLVESTGVGIHVISHLRKAQGKSHEEGGRVTLDDLRGSASLKQLSDTIIGYERDQQSPEDSNKTQSRVLKCRLTGRTGTADVLEYCEETGRLEVVQATASEPQVSHGEDF